jgi:hypothetical protein
MKQINITIHPFSALIGAAIVCLTMLTVGAVTVQGSSSTRDVSAIEVVSDPHPRDFVRIVEGSAYTVPSGKVLVPTAFGSNQWSLVGGVSPSATYVVLANSVEVWREYKHGSNLGTEVAPNEMTATIPTGLSFAEQTLVSVSEYSPTSTGVLLGYLVDA